MPILKKIISGLLSLIDLAIVPFNITPMDQFEKAVDDCDSILDLGCGHSSGIRYLKKRKKYTVGVDLSEECIRISRERNIHDENFVLDILDIEKKIKPKSFDCVILLEVIEHLTKNEGLQIIKKMEKIATKKIVVTTPNGFLPQDEYDENIYQFHKSGWKTKDFKKLNFKVYGFNGLKFIRGDYAKVKLKPIELWTRISLFSNFFVKFFPQLAFNLLCVKELKA